jgi:hypothetical protein
MSFFMDSNQNQGDSVPASNGLFPQIVVNPDTCSVAGIAGSGGPRATPKEVGS